MTAAEFERLFEPSIRAFFNFDRFKAERWPITVMTITDRDRLGKITLPWARDERRHGDNRRRLTVANAVTRLHLLDPDRRAAVLEIAAELASAKSVPVHALPAAISAGSVLLLDGCHRAVAAHLVGRVALVVVAVRAPQSRWAVVD